MIASALVCAASARTCSPSVARPASASATSRKAVWIAFSYCATAMSRLTSATSRLARLRPASKIGCSSCAVPVKAQLPLLNRPESSVLAVPKLAVSEMRGKNAAGRADVGVGGEQLLLGGADVGPARRAAPTAGRPARRPASCSSSSGSGARQVGGQRLADQQLQRVLVERALAQRQGERGPRAFEQRLGLPVVELGGGAVVEAQLGEAGRLLARRQRLRG